MEPCSTPPYKTAAKPVCGCATASEPVPVFTTAPEMYTIESLPRPADESVPVAVPLLAAAFAVFVFARQRRPSRIVVLGIFRLQKVSRRSGFEWPRLELSDAERRLLAVLRQGIQALCHRAASICRDLKPETWNLQPRVYSQPRLRNQ
jgi:hypothetical protein